MHDCLATDTKKAQHVWTANPRRLCRACRMVNTRFQQTPAAVVYARQTSDVQAAVKCAYNNNVQVRLQGMASMRRVWTQGLLVT